MFDLSNNIQDGNENNANEDDSMNTSNLKETDETPIKGNAEESQKEETSSENKVKDTSNVEAEESHKEEAVIQDTEDKTIVDETAEEIQEKKDEDDGFSLPFLIGRKIGMTQVYANDGFSFPSTVIQAGPCVITQIKNYNNDGYSAVQLGYENAKKNKINKSTLGHFKKSKSEPKSFIKEFRLNKDNDSLKLGDEVTVSQFNIGDLICVTGFSKGKGFTGHMKRYGFSGGRASHGKNSVMRKSGSVGAGTSPGRIFPGMKMAGRKGNDRVSIKNLDILNIDKKNNLIFVNGAVPGPNNNIVYLTKKII